MDAPAPAIKDPEWPQSSLTQRFPLASRMSPGQMSPPAPGGPSTSPASG